MRELPSLSRAGGNEPDKSLGRFCNGPVAVGRNGAGITIADLHGRRSIGVAQINRVVGAAAVAFFLEQNFLAVAADVAGDRPAEPT
jgi:hypothetical protein